MSLDLTRAIGLGLRQIRQVGIGGALASMSKHNLWFALLEGSTFQERFRSLVSGTLVGEDKYGNKYYEEPGVQSGRHRWVSFKTVAPECQAASVPPEWHAWLHHVTDDTPNTVPYPSVPVPHSAEGELRRVDLYGIPAHNVSGTSAAYVPKGSFANPQRRMWKKYTSWDPVNA